MDGTRGRDFSNLIHSIKAGRKLVAPSILSADFACLKKDIRALEKAGAKWLHVDVMDGRFVPNITIGPVVVKAIRRATAKMFLDVHLMIEDPSRFVEPFLEAGSDAITFHIESIQSKNLRSLLKYVRKRGIVSGVSLKPKTKIESLKPFLPLVDLVLVMSVEPGFGGQKYISCSTEKIRRLKDGIITAVSSEMRPIISVDGGIDADTIKDASSAGAQILVAGSAVFSSSDGLSPAKAYKRLQGIIS